jgi:hypothetical protein
MTTLHAGRFVKFSEYYPTKSESGRVVYVDPSSVVAVGEGGDNHERTGRTTWLEVRSGPNGRIYVLEPIATVLELLASAVR